MVAKPVLIKREYTKPKLEKAWRPPGWRGIFEDWSKSWVRKHFWRVAAHCRTHEDALQECGLQFAKCVARYRYTVDNDAWFMGLYKTAVSRHWHTLSVSSSLKRENESSVDVEFVDAAIAPEVEFFAVLSKAPEEIHVLFEKLIDAPTEWVDYLFSGSCTEVINRRLRKIYQISKEINAVENIKNILEQS